MPAAYSYDLRKKAMEGLDGGENRETVAARFKIERTTLWEWRQRNRQLSIKKTWKWGYKMKCVCQQEEKLYRKWLNFMPELASKRFTVLLKN